MVTRQGYDHVGIPYKPKETPRENGQIAMMEEE